MAWLHLQHASQNNYPNRERWERGVCGRWTSGHRRIDKSNSNAICNPNVESDAHAYANTRSNCYPNSDLVAVTDAYLDANCDCDCDSNGYCHRNSNGYSDSNGNS